MSKIIMRGLYEHSSRIIPRSALERPLIAGRELDVKPISSNQIFLNSGPIPSAISARSMV